MDLPMRISGEVVPGAGRGRKLGVPTANVKSAQAFALASGIYAGRAQVREQWYQAAISWGPAPTFAQNIPQLEVHLLDFLGADIVGETIVVEIRQWLREIRKFATVAELKEAIKVDIEKTKMFIKT